MPVAMAFVVFLVAFMWELIRERTVAGLVAFLTFLAAHIGEFTMFSPRGGGAFGWITVGAAAAALGDRCWSPAQAAMPHTTGRQ